MGVGCVFACIWLSQVKQVEAAAKWQRHVMGGWRVGDFDLQPEGAIAQAATGPASGSLPLADGLKGLGRDRRILATRLPR